jgi:DNA repair photolyase
MPVLPGITDDPHALDALVKRVAEAGALRLGACSLRLQHEARKRYLPFIAQEFPHLAARYRDAYAHNSSLGERYRSGLAAFMERACRKHGIGWRTYGYDEDVEQDASAAPVRVAEQLTLPLYPAIAASL